MNFDNIRINDAYSKMYAPKSNVNESTTNEGVGQLRRVRAVKYYDKGWGWMWKLVDDISGQTIQKYDFLDNLKKDVKEFGYLVMNDIDKEDAEATRNDTTIGEDAKDARNGGPGADSFDREYSFDVALKAKYLFDELARGLKASGECEDPAEAYQTLKFSVQLVLRLGYNHYFGKTIMQQKEKIINAEKSTNSNRSSFRGNHEADECAQTNEDVDMKTVTGGDAPSANDNTPTAVQNTTTDATAAVEEADDGSETENSDNKEIYTLDITSISNENRSIDDMKWSSIYFDFDQACDAAMDCAKEYANDQDVINVSVIAGEYQKPNGDIYGEPSAVYTVSNKDEETTAEARAKANFVSKYVDGYATDDERHAEAEAARAAASAAGAPKIEQK